MKIKSIFFLLLVFLPFVARAQTAPVGLLYAPTTSAYLARSYWLLNGVDPENRDNIDQYLMITECDLYQQFYSNDVEWDKIRQATKKYVLANKASFPTRFEFVQPIFLDRYDTATGTFSLQKRSQLIGIKQMQASGNRLSDYPCADNSRYRPDIFPLNAIVTFPRPINYSEVKMNTATAAEYIKYIDDNNFSKQEGRPAYIRYRFKVEQSLKPAKDQGETFANFFGSLESMTVFGDRDFFIKLEDVKF